MPEDDNPLHPSAPKYTPARHLIKPPSLTAEDLISYYNEFYESLKDNSCAPALAFERLAANFIGSLTQPPIPTQGQGHDNCIAALEKCRDEKEALRVKIHKLEAELETAKKELETVKEAPLNIEIMGTGPNIGGFHSSRGLSKDIVFSPRYSAPLGVSVGMRWIHVKGKDIRVASYATDIRDDGFRIHYGDPGLDNTIRSTVRSSWLVVPPNDPNFQSGIINTEEGDPTVVSDGAIWQITFARPYDSPPDVVTYLSAYEAAAGQVWYAFVHTKTITTTGFTLRTRHWGRAKLPKYTVSWVSKTANMRNAYMGSFNLDKGHNGNQCGYIKFSNSFTAPPRVLLAINSISSDEHDGTQIMIDSPMIDTNGFNWNIQSRGVKLTSLWVSYIALG